MNLVPKLNNRCDVMPIGNMHVSNGLASGSRFMVDEIEMKQVINIKVINIYLFQ